MSFAPCQPSYSEQEFTLEKPPEKCDSSYDKKQKSLRSQRQQYKGPFINGTIDIAPLKDIPIMSSAGLRDISQTPLPTSWSWLEQGTSATSNEDGKPNNKIENGDRNQGQCGSCWSFATASVLGDRYAIKYNIPAPYPSTTNLISCMGPTIGSSYTANVQCQCGGSVIKAAEWLQQSSIKSDNCLPYTMLKQSQGNQLTAPNCSDWFKTCCENCCESPEAKKEYSVMSGSVKRIVSRPSFNIDLDSTIISIKREIMGKGPVATSILVPSDFENWWASHSYDKSKYPGYLLSDEIYVPTGGNSGGHAICITGWGKKGNIEYWEIRNSWGSPGYAYFAMSNSTPKQFWTGIDVPITSNGMSIGGAVSFDAGPLSTDKKDYGEGVGGHAVGKGWKGEILDWKMIIMIAGVLLGIILITTIIGNIL